MKISELIEALQEALEVDGDWDVYAHDVPTDTQFPIDDIQINHIHRLIFLE